MQATSRRSIFRLSASTLAFAVVLGLAATVHAAEVKKLAILVPEEGTDFGWNQQGHDAAKAVERQLGTLGVQTTVKPTPQARLVATLSTPRGEVQLT